MLLLSKSKKRVSSRQQIRIKEIRDGILILPNNQYRVILEVSSVNFELKSEAEQDVLIDNFQLFLNALPCPLQFLVRVREVDIDHYLAKISHAKASEKETIYKEQIANYSTFIKNLVAGNKILSRRFYVVIPYSDTHKDFDLIKEQLMLRRDIVKRGIEKLGMKAAEINSLELLELFYSFYNPTQAKTQELKEQTIQMILQNSYA